MRAYVHGSSGLVYPVDILPETTPTTLLKSLSLFGELRNSYGSVLDKALPVLPHVVDHGDLYLSTPSAPSSQSAPAQSLTSFSWEDSDEVVTVRFPVKNPEILSCKFQDRSFELLVSSDGAPFRFRCGRTHGLIDPAKCAYRVSKNSTVVVKLRKLGGKADGPWFDLFKKKAIGDTDAV